MTARRRSKRPKTPLDALPYVEVIAIDHDGQYDHLSSFSNDRSYLIIRGWLLDEDDDYLRIVAGGAFTTGESMEDAQFQVERVAKKVIKWMKKLKVG